MSASEVNRAPSATSLPQPLGCPWCGDGTQLLLRGDGVGGSALWCKQCLCKGPTVEIEGDFESSDKRAIQRWSTRTNLSCRINPAMLERIYRMISLQLMVGNIRGAGTTRVPVELEDLQALLHAAGVSVTQTKPGDSLVASQPRAAA